MAVAHNKDIQINLKELAKTFDDDLKLKNPLVYMVYTKNFSIARVKPIIIITIWVSMPCEF